MGYVSSGSTITARAYLTGRGRELLFDKDNIRFDQSGDDLFMIKTFTLGDPDTNYRTSNILGAGTVPDISGKYTSCLKTSVNYEQKNLLFYQNFDQVVSEDVEYTSDANNNVLNVNINLSENDLPVGTDSSAPVSNPASPEAQGVRNNQGNNNQNGPQQAPGFTQTR